MPARNELMYECVAKGSSRSAMASARVVQNVADITVCWSVGWSTMVSRGGVLLSLVWEMDNTGETPADEIPTEENSAGDAPTGSTETEDLPTCTSGGDLGLFGISDLGLEICLPT